MKIGLVQSNIQWESKDENSFHAEEFIKKASREACDVVVFPEMFNTGFSMNIAAIAEEECGETSLLFSRLALEYNVNLIAGYTVKSSDPGRGRNQAVVYDRQGKLLTRFVKLHSFSFAKEDQYYMTGNEIVTFDIEGMLSSIFICFDLRFPEVFREIAKRVQTIFVIANWPSTRIEHWEVLLKARAIENQCFVIGVNRTGRDGNGIDYCGRSKIFGPLGNEMCSGGETEELLIGEIDPHEVMEVRQKFPFLISMRSV